MKRFLLLFLIIFLISLLLPTKLLFAFSFIIAVLGIIKLWYLYKN